MNTVIVPSIGRVMWYYAPQDSDPIHDGSSEPFAAIVASVTDEGKRVNLAVFNRNGGTYSATNVPVIQEGDITPKGSHVRWMPYQIGQAANQAAKTAGPATTLNQGAKQ